MDGETNEPTGCGAFPGAGPGGNGEEKQLGREPVAGRVEEEGSALEDAAGGGGMVAARVRANLEAFDGGPPEGLAIRVEGPGTLACGDADEALVLPSQEAFAQQPAGASIEDGAGVRPERMGRDDPCEAAGVDALKDLAGSDVLQVHGEGTSVVAGGTSAL